MSTPDKSDNDLKLVEEHIQALGEHFDSVHIFCTRHESGELDGTVKVSRGIGNWFARRGQIAEWLIMEDEASRQSVRKEE